jgi:flagellar biosynthesis protein FlhF
MQLRTFIANDMREALGQVRKEMGADAVIVASQRAKGGGVMVRAALDAAVDTTEEERALVAADAAPTAQPEPAQTETAPDFAQTYHEGLIRRLRSEPEPLQPSKHFNRAELLGILRSHRAPDALAHQLAESAEKSGLSDMTLALASALDRRMRATPLAGIAQSIVLLGPSGAGKSAVAAKIAAHARLAGRAVKLVAADTAGAGAVARLETFGNHLGVEVVTADTTDAVAEAVQMEGDGLTIVDTAGFDPRDANARTAYAALARFEDAEAIGVLSATSDAEETSEIAAALASLGAERLIVTGLDVTRRLGALLAGVAQGAGLAHVTRSPFVAGGLETLTPLSLSRMLIGVNTGNADRGSPQ